MRSERDANRELKLLPREPEYVHPATIAVKRARVALERHRREQRQWKNRLRRLCAIFGGWTWNR